MRREQSRLAVWAYRGLLTLGCLALVEAGLAYFWQEPFTAWSAGRAQAGLEQSYLQQQKRFAPAAGKSAAAPSAAQLRRGAGRYRQQLKEGDSLGRLRIDRLDRSYWVVEGDSPPVLRKGPGHYHDTALPGEGKTVGIAGHRTTYGAPFRNIDRLRKGDEIVLDVPYARLRYRVYRTRIVRPDQVEVKRDLGFEQLILSACHPRYSAKQRIVVMAKLTEAQAPPPPGSS